MLSRRQHYGFGALGSRSVYQALRKKYKIKCYNCGVSGAIAERVTGYMYSECFIYNPDYVVLMLGMNDFNMKLYSTSDALNSDEETERKRLFDLHMREYEEIIKECHRLGTEVIICLPTPYDEASECNTERLFYQSVLEKACEFQTETAQKYNCKVVNFKDNMLPLLSGRQIIQDDRVHPTEYGYHVMAQIFLREVGEIEECDFDTPFEFETWNKQRYEAEMKNRKLNYVELCDTYYEGYALKKSPDEIKLIAQKRLEEYSGNSEFIPSAYREYIENGHLRFDNKGDVVRLTVF